MEFPEYSEPRHSEFESIAHSLRQVCDEYLMTIFLGSHRDAGIVNLLINTQRRLGKENLLRDMNELEHALTADKKLEQVFNLRVFGNPSLYVGFIDSIAAVFSEGLPPSVSLTKAIPLLCTSLDSLLSSDSLRTFPEKFQALHKLRADLEELRLRLQTITYMRDQSAELN